MTAMDGGSAGFARLQDVGGRVESGTETEEQKSVDQARRARNEERRKKIGTRQWC